MAKIKKAQKGAALTKVTDSIKPARPNYDGYRPPYVPSGKNQSKFDEGIESVKKLYQDGKLKQRRTGGAVKKAQKGASVQSSLERKLPKKAPIKKAPIKKIPVKKAPTSKPGINTIVPTGGRNFYDIDMSKKDRISPEMSRQGKSIKKNMLAKSGTKLKKK